MIKSLRDAEIQIAAIVDQLRNVKLTASEAVKAVDINTAIEAYLGQTSKTNVTSVSGTSITPTAVVPSNVTISVDSEDAFTLTVNWTVSTSLQDTTGYSVQVRYFNDVACTDPIGDWIDLGNVSGGSTSTTSNGPNQRQIYDSYVKAEVAGIDSKNGLTAYVESATPALVAAGTGGSIIVPTDLGSGDWSVAINGSGQDLQTFKQQERIYVTVTVRPTDADGFRLWIYPGNARPSDPSLWKDVSVSLKSASGNTYLEYWIDLKAATQEYQCCVTPWTYVYTTFPSATIPIHNVVTSAISLCTLPSAFNVTATSKRFDGALLGIFTIDATFAADTKRTEIRIERRATDSAYANPGAWQVIFSLLGDDTFPWAQSPYGWAWPTVDEYWQWRIGPVTFKGDVNWYGTIINTHLTPSGGFDASAISVSTLVTLFSGSAIQVGSVIRIGGADNENIFTYGTFDEGNLNGWLLEGVAGRFSATGSASAVSGNYILTSADSVGAGNSFASTNWYPCKPGEKLYFSTYCQHQTSPGGTFNVYLQYADYNKANQANGLVLDGNSGSSGVWNFLDGLDTVPSGKTYARAVIFTGNTKVCYVDSITGRKSVLNNMIPGDEIQGSKIYSLSADKIVAGTITATIAINFTSGYVNIQMNDSLGFKIYNSNTGNYVQLHQEGYAWVRKSLSGGHTLDTILSEYGVTILYDGTAQAYMDYSVANDRATIQLSNAAHTKNILMRAQSSGSTITIDGRSL